MASPQDLVPGGTTTPTTMSQQTPPQTSAVTLATPATTTIPATIAPQTTPIPSPASTPTLVDGPLSAPVHKVALPPPPSGGSLVPPSRVSPSPKPSGASPRSSPAGTTKDSEGQRVIVTTRTPIFVRSYTPSQTTQSSPNQPASPRITAATIRPTPTGQVMPTTAGQQLQQVQQVQHVQQIQQVRPISGQVRPIRGHARSIQSAPGRATHVNQIRVMANGPMRPTTAQALMQARAQIRAQARSGGLVIREQTPPSRSPPQASRGQQPRIRIPISAAGRGVQSSIMMQGAQVRGPFYPHAGSPTLLAYPQGNTRLQAALSGNHVASSRVTMTTTGQLIVQAQTKPSPGNGQISPRLASPQIRHGLVSPTRARMPSSHSGPSHSHHKPILPSPGRTITSNHQLLTVAGPQQNLHQAHRPTAQIRAHLPRVSPRPTGPIQAHSHHNTSDPTLHSSPDATPINLVTSPKGSPQLQPVDMSAKSNHSPSSTTIPTQSHIQSTPRSSLKSEGSDSDTSSKNSRFKVTSTAAATSSTNPTPGPSSSANISEPMDTEGGGSEVTEAVIEIPKEIPKAVVKPHILTHVIDGFIIEESKEPFPVTSGILSEANVAYKNTPPQSKKRPASEPVEEGALLRCEFCGKMDSPRKFKRSKRFCSMACAKRYNVGCSKRLGLFSPRQPEKPEKTKYKLKLQLKAKPLKGQRGKHGRLSFNVSQPWSKAPQLENVQLPQETSSSGSSSSSAPSEENPSSPSPNVVVSSPSRSDQSFQYSDDSDDLPPGLGRDPGSWSVEHVATFIRTLPGCGDYAEQFHSQEIDGQALMLLKEDHLMTAMNMKLGPALKIINKINTLKDK
ncbi:uncharacterized protein [Diadema antillarum]|uniref:uncharacterized protein n=1 Tax=Diadema antillarum TaxID=105358 RepID=UPI003A837C03